jgi:hypothetical protein
MKQILLIFTIIVTSCTTKRARSADVITSTQQCDSSSISISFKDNIHDSLVKGGAMVILLKGVEEDIESVFTDPQRMYYLNKEHHLCLDRTSLYSKYYIGGGDTLQALVYRKEVGYSYPFDIIVADSFLSISLSLAFDATGRQYSK